MNVEPHSTARDSKVRAILEKYFGIDIGQDHAILEQVGMLHLAGGDWLMHQGEEGDALYFLVRGRLQAWAAGADGKDRGTFLNEIVPGDSVGELSLLTGAPRAVGIQAIRDSLLVSIDRETFESLSMQFPALALKLAANVAKLLQKGSNKNRPSTRNLKVISLLPLDPSSSATDFAHQLARAVSREEDTAILRADRLGDHGSPVADATVLEDIPPALAHWLHDLEDEHRYLLLQCDPASPAWTRFALRQSDMVLMVADSDASPYLRPWEKDLQESTGAAIARRMLVLLHKKDGPYLGTAPWLKNRPLDFHVHVRKEQAGDVARVARIIEGNALGLVLAGGAARGFAHLGVYKAMEELGQTVDWIGGTSIGGIMGAALATHWSIDESIQRARECFVDGRPFTDFTLPVVSLIRGRRMDRLLEQHLDFDIEDLPTPFFCISCHLDSGTLKVHETGPLAPAVRAGASIPGIIPPAVVDRRLTVDGAVINNLPVDIMQRKPVGSIVAVDLSSDKQYEVDYPSLPSSWAILRGRYLPFARRYRVPSFSTVMLKATELGTLERVRRLGRQADLLLNPPVRQFGMTEVKSFERIIQAGYEHAMEELPGWLESRGIDTRTESS